MTIETILAKPGSAWTAEELRFVLDWLLWKDPCGLCVYAEGFFHWRWPRIDPGDASEIFNLFLERRLKPSLAAYDPERGALGPFLCSCLKSYCNGQAIRHWEALQQRALIFPADVGVKLAEIPDGSFSADPDMRLQQRELEGDLRRALAELRPSYREALVMQLRGKSYETIAEELGLSVAVVRNRIFRARQQLRRKLAELRADRGMRGDQR